MNAPPDSHGGSTMLRALFALIAGLLLASIGYATWLVVAYWDRVGV